MDWLTFIIGIIVVSILSVTVINRIEGLKFKIENVLFNKMATQKEKDDAVSDCLWFFIAIIVVSFLLAKSNPMGGVLFFVLMVFVFMMYGLTVFARNAELNNKKSKNDSGQKEPQKNTGVHLGHDHMSRLEAIQKQISSLDETGHLLTLKEIKELPKILWEDECVEQIIEGIYSGGNGVLVATNKRLVFIDKGLMFGLKVEDFLYNKITSIQYEAGMFFGKITIFASGNKAEIESLGKSRTRVLAEFVRTRITAASNHASVPKTNSAPQADDVVSKLERLVALKSQGILTEEEFLDQKKRILNG